MWTMIPSLQQVVDCLAPAFTQPSFATCGQLLLAWALCLGKHTLMRVGHSADPTEPPDLSRRHGLDTYYNFFERSAGPPAVLAQRVGGCWGSGPSKSWWCATCRARWTTSTCSRR